MNEIWKTADDGEAGLCPICDCDLEYDNVRDCDGGVCYPWHCPNCGAEGEEVYAIEFSHHNYKTKEKIK